MAESDKRYRQKPIEVEAAQWHRHGDDSRVKRYSAHPYFKRPGVGIDHDPENQGWIKVREGSINVDAGDWIVSGTGHPHPMIVRGSEFQGRYERIKTEAMGEDLGGE